MSAWREHQKRRDIHTARSLAAGALVARDCVLLRRAVAGASASSTLACRQSNQYQGNLGGACEGHNMFRAGCGVQRAF